MGIKLAVIGAGQFAGQFGPLFKAHPLVSEVYAVDLLPTRAAELARTAGLDGVYDSFELAIADPSVDAVAILTQRWTHGPMAVAALRAGKHVYSAVPMAISVDEIGAILDAVAETGLTYMMGETSYYNPATVFIRDRVAEGALGTLFYAEGDYVHDMDLGFYDAYKFSGGDSWKSTASFPPMLYPTHAIGGVLGAWDTFAVSVSCIGIPDRRGDGVFDRTVSDFDNDFSNASALFELADGGVMRTNEFRRVGYPSSIRESRFRFFGTEASFEQTAEVSSWQDRGTVTDVSAQLHAAPSVGHDHESLRDVAPELRDQFVSGLAPVHHRDRLPREFDGLPNGHEGSHHFLVDDFVTAVATNTAPPVHAWRAARFTLPGVIAHQSARQGAERLIVPDFGDPIAERYRTERDS